MVSLITTPTCGTYSHLKYLPFSSVGVLLRSQKRVEISLKIVCKKSEVKRVRSEGNSLCCWSRKGGYDGDGDSDSELEEKLLEFMEKSDKPWKFPTKEELLNAGRYDLVKDIRRKGGWFSLGWDVEDGKNEEEKEMGKVIEIEAMNFDMDKLQEQVKNGEESNFLGDVQIGKSFLGDSAQLPSSLDVVTNEESGVQGILSRLEKERNSSLGINLGKSINQSKVYEDSKEFKNKTDPDNHYTWRSWSNERAGFHNTEFEAGEILYEERKKDLNEEPIQIRLHILQMELSSTLDTLRSKKVKTYPKKGNELQKLTDEWEFQENEVMNAKETLRRIRSKLAVLKGKMALTITDAQKIVEDKKKRSDGAYKALHLLVDACVVWPNTASEVLLVGSFDGWTNQRKMEKSSSGIFSLSLKLYPGRYEMKFIVDGVWKIDPLRPTIRSNGYENNLLVVM